MQVRAEQRADRAAKIISLASLLLLFVAVALYTSLASFGWNPYIAAVALFCAGIAGYPLLSLLTHAVASQTSRAFKSLGPYDRQALLVIFPLAGTQFTFAEPHIWTAYPQSH